MRSLLLVASLAVALAGCAPAHRGTGLQVVAAENFWGSIAAQLGGDERHGTSVIVRPRDRPALLRADRLGRPRAGRSGPRDRQRDRLRPLGVAAPRREPGRGGRVVVDAGKRARPGRRRQPAPVVLAGVRRPDGRRDLARPTTSAIRRTPRTSPRGGSVFETPRARPLRRAARDASAPGSRARPSATARASSSRSAGASGCDLLTPPRFAEGRRRRAPRSAPPTRQTVERADAPVAGSPSGSTTARTRRRRSQRDHAIARRAESRS